MPSRSKFKTFDVSLDMESIHLPEKINFHKEILYIELNENALIISKEETLLEKFACRLKKEKENYHALNINNENLKDLVMKLGVNPKDRLVVDTLLKVSKIEIQELRHKLKM